jgi:hypothetical protein
LPVMIGEDVSGFPPHKPNKCSQRELHGTERR